MGTPNLQVPPLFAKSKCGCRSYLINYNLKDNFILPHDETTNEEERKAHNGCLALTILKVVSMRNLSSEFG